MVGIILQLISGLASPVIFVPSLAIGWFVRRWWQVVLGAVVMAVLSTAEIMLLEAPEGAEIDWAGEPLVFVAPLFWCAAGFLMRAWHRRVSRHRLGGPIRALSVVAGMVLGGFAVGATALGVGLLYLHAHQLDFHAVQPGSVDGSSAYERIFFQYLFPGVLMGQLAGGLIGRVFGRQIAPTPEQRPGENIALSS